MLLAQDLTARQAARVLEQAVRSRAQLEIDLRSQREAEPIRGILSARDANTICVTIDAGGRKLSLPDLIGAFADLRMELGGDLYVFTTCVMDVARRTAGLVLSFARPETIQIANRRKFERRKVSPPTQVRVWVDPQIGPHIGLLADLSANGLASLFSSGHLESLFLVGDTVRLKFAMPGIGGAFELPAVICHKMPTSDRRQLIIGFEFHATSDDAATRRSLARLRDALGQLTLRDPQTDGAE